MAQNVTVAGASYSDVPSVELPKTGGGTALFADPSITTAIASDVASGKQFLLADGSIGTGTASGGGGGASNVVTGTFKGTTTGAAMDISLPYTGSGYPIAVMIFPSEGSYGSGTFRNLIQRYAIDTVFCIKRDANTAPTYSGSGAENGYDFGRSYKSTSTNATNISGAFSGGSSGSTIVADDTDASASATSCVHLRSNKKMSVFIAASSYGFAANIEYTYHVIYSS